ncbi:MAG TPA: hypothetical protein VFO76_11530 [Candidatus Kapabacteria bacterium]|nr:hypothetical protein [Candidatus Kapabacteria bacterium]
MKKVILSLLIIVSIASLSCTSTTPSESGDSSFTINDFLPTGLKWTYRDSSADVIGGSYTTVTWVVKLDDYRNHPTFGSVQSDKPSDTSAFYLLGDTALYLVYRPLGSTDPSYVYPMAEGEERVYDKNHAATGSADFKKIILRSKSVSVTVPAGTFNCLQYDKVFYNVSSGIIDTVELATTYLLPKKGVIRSRTYDFQNGVRHLRFERVLNKVESM